MNVVERYLAERREPLALDALGVPRRPAFLVLTPRFALSRHVVVLVLDGRRPVLVAKLPRRPGDGAALAREATLLRAVAAAPSEHAEVPRLVAFDERPAHPLLVETAVVGRPLSPAALRRAPQRPAAALTAWLAELARRTAGPPDDDWYARLVREPLERLAAAESDRGLDALVARTLDATVALAATPLRCVLEHGDLAHPNLLALRDGRIGVLDWETGTTRGLPGHDLVFFLAYAGAASAGAPEAPLAPGGWGRRLLAEYGRAAGVPRELLEPLTLACAARSVATLPERSPAPPSAGRHGWLRDGRPMALWRALVTQATGDGRG